DRARRASLIVAHGAWGLSRPGSGARLGRVGLVGRARLPADPGGDVPGDRVEHARVVLHPELVGDREQERVGLADGDVLTQLLRDDVRLSGVAAPEPRERALQVADLVLARQAGAGAEVAAGLVGDDRQDTAADRDARRPLPAGLRPGLAKPLDLLGLELIEGDAGVLHQER